MTTNNEKLKQEVLKLLEEPLLTQGYEVAEVVIAQYKKGSTVRLFVYGEEGVNIDICARISKYAGGLIDGTDLFENGYTLEVSSPGLDRPLQRVQDFRYRVGELVNIQFAEAKRPSVKAKIVSVNNGEVVFENELGSFTESLADIDRAKIVY